jgi:hypothetical protein
MVLKQIGGADDSSPWTLRRDDGTPTANPGDFIICDGGTVTLPTPQQGAAVAVGNIEQITTITASAGQVEFEPEVDIDNPEPAVFVSDGSDWFVANDLDYVGAIPDTLRNQYLVGDFTTSNWPDSEGTVDIDTISGLTFDSTAFGGGGGVVGGGSDYGVSQSMDDWGNNVFPTEWAISFQFEDYTETAPNMFIGKDSTPGLTIGSHGFEGGNEDRLQFPVAVPG